MSRIRIDDGMYILAFSMILLIALIGKYDRELFFSIVIVGLFKGVESISDVYHGLFQQNERMDIISRSKIYRSIISFF